MRISDWSSDVCSSDLVFGHIRSLLRSSLLARGIREFEECYCDLFGGIGAFSAILAEPAICPNRVVIGPLVGDIFLLELPPAANVLQDCVVHVFTSLALQARVLVGLVLPSRKSHAETS